MLTRLRIVLLAALCFSSALHAQEYRWQAGFDYFFDNQEYAKSSYAPAQTMQGVRFTPVGGIAWRSGNSVNSLHAGATLLKIPGTKKAIDNIQAILYYQYDGPKAMFKAGAFPRQETLANYNDFFFSDSVRHFMPLMQGIFFQVGNERHFANAWMDWTGHATPTTRESFFLGFSGKTTYRLLFADFQSYLYHYAGTLPSHPDYGVSELMQGMASVGITGEAENGFTGLLSAGVYGGIERDREADETYRPLGFIARANAEYRGIGTQNTFYTGDARMRLFPRYGSALYWGTPFLQGTSYVHSKWYLRLMESSRVAARLQLNFHFTEGHTLFQQVLTVSVSLDNFSDNNNTKISFPWMGQ